jgi:hypothetical protein
MYLSGLFGSKEKEIVLQFVLARNCVYATQIAKFYDVNNSKIIKELEKLEYDKVLVSFKYGRMYLYD